MTAAEVLPLPEPEPGPFAGWVGIIVPADKPGRQVGMAGGGSRSATATPGKMLLLVPPNLLALLRDDGGRR